VSNILVIMRRDLRAYFTSPIGYIFIMVFVTLSVGLYITQFFMFPVADMRPYFENLPLLLCVFIPAVTMRVWAEERKENTWEMLLTFPMKAQELVIGKYLAGLIFFALALLATFTVPAMLMNLGNPDLGQTFAGYLGTLFLGAFLLAMGIFISGFFKDQIVAFVVALLTAFLFFLLGTDFIAGYIDSRLPGVGSLMGDLLGFFVHYNAFIRGVVDLADVVYFLAWITIFLVLNIIYIDGRNRPGAKTIFASAAAMSVAIGLLFNYLMTGASLLRFDLTEDRIYTVSPASVEILSEIGDPANVMVYITPRESMPTGMKTLERDIVDKLEELRVATGGMINYTTVHLEVANVIQDRQQAFDEEEADLDEDKTVESRMLDKGVEPFSVRAIEDDQVTSKLVYSSIGVAYRDRPEEIIPQVMPQNIQELEYKLVNTIHKLSLEEAPRVALVAPKEAVNIPEEMRQIYRQMGMEVPQSEDPYEYLERILLMEKYEVERVELTPESPLPADYDTLVVINPRSLSDRQRWEINRALHSGKSVVMAVQQYEWEYQPTRTGYSIVRREEQPQINELLGEYGLAVSTDVLMDANKVPLTIQTGTIQDLVQPMTVNLPMHILVGPDGMDEETAITSRLSSILYLWGTAIELDEDKLAEHGLSARTIMTTSEQSWTVPATSQLTQADFDPPATGGLRRHPLMAMVEGQFPDAFEGLERPAWPRVDPPQQPGMPPMPEEEDIPDPPSPPVEAQPGKLVLMGCSQMFRTNFLQQGNLDLFLNAVDAVSLDDRIVRVRGRKPIDRTIPRPTEGQKTAWRLANYGLANLVIAAIGIGFFALRRRSRNAYTIDQMQR